MGNKHHDMVFTSQAIIKLRPDSNFWFENGSLVWADDNKQTQPTQAEIDSELINVKKEYKAQEYSKKRKFEYPTIQECIHAILDDDLEELQKKRQAVKTKYPKE